MQQIRFPRPLDGFKGPTSKGNEGKGREWEGRETRDGSGEVRRGGREGRGRAVASLRLVSPRAATYGVTYFFLQKTVDFL